MSYFDLSFEHPWVLGLLLPLLAVMVYYYYRRTAPSLKINRLLPDIQGNTFRKGLLKISQSLPWLSAMAILVSLAGPYHSLSVEEQTGEGIDIFMAMDISGSMLARDFEPNRLEVSKNVASSFIAKRPFDRIGLAAFAGEAYTLSPLTMNQQLLQNFIRQLQVGQLQDGTAIGMGLATAINRLDSSGSTSRIIILLTDGENTTGYIDPETAMQIAEEKDIKVYTIGVGSKGEAPMPYAKRNDEYIYRMSKVNMDEKLLKKIANTTGGKYYRANNERELEQIYNEINALEKSEVMVEVFHQKKPAFAIFLFLAILGIILHLLLEHFIIKSWP